jgi:hypothetical protein
VLHEWRFRPLLFVTEALGAEPYPWQRQVLEWLGAGETRISVRSGHGVGKTALEAWLALWFPLTRPDAKVGITAPAGPQIEANLWPEIRKWFPRLRDRTGGLGAWMAARTQVNELEIEFPLVDDDAVIPVHLIDSAMNRAGKIARVEGLAPVWGVDVAWMGGDRSALAKRCGNELLEPVRWWSGNDPHQTALRVYDEWRQTDEEMRPAVIMVDIIGMGAGTQLKLRELGLPARGINVGESAAASERYAHLRDELWFRGRAWLDEGAAILPRDNALKAELVAVTYSMTPSGKVKVASKEELRKRGQRSPDLADAFLLTLAGGEHKRAPGPKAQRYASGRNEAGSWMSR